MVAVAGAYAATGPAGAGAMLTWVAPHSRMGYGALKAREQWELRRGSQMRLVSMDYQPEIANGRLRVLDDGVDRVEC